MSPARILGSFRRLATTPAGGGSVSARLLLSYPAPKPLRLLTTSRRWNSQAATARMGKDEKQDAQGNGGKSDEPPPPALSDHDFRIYNQMADKMDAFHNYFRSSWTLLWTACTTSRRPQNMTLRQFLAQGLSFAEHLAAHHAIEEQFVFPRLAARMPEFDPRRGDMVAQHARIHAGLEAFEGYLKRCQRGEQDFDMGALKEKMESWGDVLWAHLDEEVKVLGAENMRKYWSKEDMMRMHM